MYPWESELPALAALSDAEAAEAITAITETVSVQRFASFRTLASALTPEEYTTVRGTLDAVAAQSVLVADMVAMLKLPGDEQGNGGGIDLGNATTQAMLDQLCTPTVAAKIKAIATVTRPKYPTAWPGEVKTARAQQ